MAFKSDKQRKAVMAQLNPPNRSQTAPVVQKPSRLQRLRGFVAKQKEKRRQKTEIKGFERIQKEKIALEKERITAKRLKMELETEQAREQVAQQRRETQAEFSKIETQRLSRTRRGRAILLARRTPALARKGIIIGVKKGIKELRKPAPRARRRKRRTETETAPFGIE